MFCLNPKVCTLTKVFRRKVVVIGFVCGLNRRPRERRYHSSTGTPRRDVIRV